MNIPEQQQPPDIATPPTLQAGDAWFDPVTGQPVAPIEEI